MNLMKLIKLILVLTEIAYCEKNENKYFSNYQMLIELFKNLRDSIIEPIEVLRSQAKFKSDLNEIKIGGKNH